MKKIIHSKQNETKRKKTLITTGMKLLKLSLLLSK